MNERYVVIVECANGNESVGTMWMETKVFEADIAISEIWEWAHKHNGGEGKVIITKEGGKY